MAKLKTRSGQFHFGRRLRKADCASGFGFVLLGAGVLQQASEIPMGGTYAGVDKLPFRSCLEVSLSLVVSSSSERGAREGGLQGIFGALKRALGKLVRGPAWRGVLAFGLLIGYDGLLRLRLIPGWDGQNYIVSSTVFLATFALCFFRPHGQIPEA